LVAPRLNSAEHDVKAVVRIILVQARLEIRRRIVIGEIHYTPLNIEDAIGRTA
jgi:hypothetical protein